MKTNLTIILICVLYCRLHAQVSFVLSSTMPLGPQPASVTAADINGDGKPDLITAIGGNNTVTVLTNDGHGGFVTSGTYAVGSGPFQVAVADIDRDGKVDLISGNNGTNTLTVLTNDGKGGFSLSTTLIVGNNPESVFAADLSGHGKLDLVTANYGDSTLTVLTNDGSGGFLLATTLNVGSGPKSVTASDVNGDGKLDLVSANGLGASISVLTNDGHGGFVTSGTYAVGDNPNQVIAADINRDGKPDLITANYGSGTLTILTNDGFGGFVLASVVIDVFGVRSVVAADVNGDGSLDLISAPGLNDTVTVFTNDGRGGFTLAASVTGPGSYPFWVAASDVNGDGKPDAICVNVFGNSITVLTNATPFPSPPPFLTDGLVAYYPFNGNANDASGNGNDGTVQGPTLTSDRFGEPNSAYYFDGLSGGIKIPDTLLSPTVDGFTFSVWVGTDNGPYPGDYEIIHTGTDNGETLMNISSGQFAFGPILDTHAGYIVTSPINSNSVTHVVGVYSRGQNVSLYTNGVLAAIIPVPDGTLWLEPTYPLYSAIGIYEIYSPSPYLNFRGVLDDIRVYNRALSSNEVAQLYAYESRSDANPPSITGQPEPVTINVGSNASFTVTAAGASPLNYQWSLNGTNISGANANTLTISNVSQTDLGEYAVVVSNSFGSTNSSDALLSMYPFIETPFTGVIAYWGKDTTLSLEGWGTGPLRYQWYDNGVAILNATNQMFFLPSIQFTNAGLYSVVLSNPLGSVTNVSAQVVVNPAGVSLGMFPGVYVSGVVGYTYTIQASSDLTNTNGWTTVATLTLIQPIQLWVDTVVNALSPTNPHKYYRVVPGG